MGSPRLRAALSTALAPCLWGTTYVVFTQTLPVDHPFLVSALRALPAGLLLMAFGAGLPPRNKLLPLVVLGLANIGVFFVLLFVAAARLPGGLAATLSSAQPLMVAFLAWPLLGRAPRPMLVLAALFGMSGVAVLVFDPGSVVDPLGAAAALGSAASMAVGTVLVARWGRVGSPIQLAAWQLALGGALLVPLAHLVEGVPPLPTERNLLGLAYLVVFGTALAYWLFVRGIGLLGPDAAFLGLLSPVVATIIGALFLGEWLSSHEWLGIAIVLGATLVGIWFARPARRPS